MGPLSGNALLKFARLDPGKGIWNLYNTISVASFAHTCEPELVDVRYPQVQVTQAYYDKQARRLAIAVAPGTDAQAKTMFAVRNLSGKERFDCTLDDSRAIVVQAQ